MKKKKELIIILGSLLVVILSVTLAYFTTEIFGSGKEISVENLDLKIVFTNGTGKIVGTDIVPGWSSGISTFTVKNESDDTYKYNIVIKDLVNTFVTNGFLLYKITSIDGGYNMSDFVDVPKSSTATDTDLAYSVEIAKGVTHTYSVEFKYENSSEVDQSDDMGKKLSGTLFIEKGTEKPVPLYNKILANNPTISERTDFSTIFTTTNTGTLYKATESIAGSTPKDVYYFAGDAKNNWVKFGTYETNGPVRGYYIANNFERFREYSSIAECKSASNYNGSCNYAWYAGDPMYWRIIRTNHDGSIRLLYSGTSPDTKDGHIGISKFNSIYADPMYVGYMYGTSGSLETNRTNENDSTIKTFIDTWYSSNLSSYTKYLSTEAVYCNDREVSSNYTYSTSSTFDYASVQRLDRENKGANANPTYDCTNIKDAFSGSNTEAKLTYPIALMTADEVAYAGGVAATELTSPYAWYYLNSAGGSITAGRYWWLLSPYIPAFSWVVYAESNGPCLMDYRVGWRDEYDEDLQMSGYVRPVISIKGDTLSSGDGSPENPYEIVYN